MMASAAVMSNIAPCPISPAQLHQRRFHFGPKSSFTSMTGGRVASAPRGRRERPCDACRKRKSKCVVTEGQKRCAACAVHSQECTYVEEPQPRKRRMDSDGKESELSKRRSTVSSSTGATASSTDLRVDTAPSFDTVSTSSSSTEKHRKPSHYYSTHIGPTTEIEPILLDLSIMNGNTSPGDMYEKHDGRTAFLVDQLEAERIRESKSTALEQVEQAVRSHGAALLRIYLNTTHSNFPMIEDDFFSDYFEGNIANLDPTLLAAIYALTLPWYARDAVEPGSIIPDGIRLEDLAFKLFGDSLSKPTLSTIQAGILLMQRPNVDSKTLNTQLVAAAYELGLHLDCTSWTSPAGDKGLRKRLAWALYMQDKWCALIHGRPSAIVQSNWAVRSLNDEDFDNKVMSSDADIPEEELERGWALFKHMASLTEILSTLLDTFYTLQAMQEVDDAGQGGTRLILERAKPVQIRLKAWFAGLPSNLKMDNTMTGKPSSTGYLHLSYFATEITLHRCIIRSLEPENGDQYLTHICRAAAKTRLISAMDFVNRLREEHLNAFWYFPSKVNFALIGTFGSLLLATAPCQEEVDFYRTRLSEYRWTLSASSKTADFLTFAVDSLDSSNSLLKNLPRRPSTNEFSAQFTTAMPRQRISPPQDEMMTEAPPMHLGQLPHMQGGGREANASGLVSPSTSTSSGSTSYEAYAEAFPIQRQR